MNIKPLFDKVVVEAVNVEEKTKSGFILPSSAQEKPQTCVVVAVGPGGDLSLQQSGQRIQPGKIDDDVAYAAAKKKRTTGISLPAGRRDECHFPDDMAGNGPAQCPCRQAEGCKARMRRKGGTKFFHLMAGLVEKRKERRHDQTP